MRIVVVGATDEAINTMRILINRGHEVIVLDDDKTRIDKVVQELDIPAYMFSITDLTALTQAGLHKADMVLALHPLDIVNILVCVYAKHFEIPRILAVVESNEAARVLEKLGLAHTILVRSRALSKALMELIYDIKLVEIDDENYLVLFVVRDDSRMLDKTIDDIEKEGANVIAVTSSENKLISFDKNYTIKKGDKLIFIVKKNDLESILLKG